MSLMELILRLREQETAARAEKTSPASVIGTAGILDRSEFDIFVIAHHEWFGVDISDRAMEDIFKPYVFTGETPFWVRFFCQRIAEQKSTGELDISRYQRWRNDSQTNGEYANTLIA